ncbi:uncharacterized protein ACO6RY_05805 [Pungitius sinensis]
MRYMLIHPRDTELPFLLVLAVHTDADSVKSDHRSREIFPKRSRHEVIGLLRFNRPRITSGCNGANTVRSYVRGHRSESTLCTYTHTHLHVCVYIKVQYTGSLVPCVDSANRQHLEGGSEPPDPSVVEK